MGSSFCSDLLEGTLCFFGQFVAVHEVDHQADDFRIKIVDGEFVFLRLQKLLGQQHRLQDFRLVGQNDLVAGERPVAGDDLEIGEFFRTRMELSHRNPKRFSFVRELFLFDLKQFQVWWL
jgi:hypothetical protein